MTNEGFRLCTCIAVRLETYSEYQFDANMVDVGIYDLGNRDKVHTIQMIVAIPQPSN